MNSTTAGARAWYVYLARREFVFSMLVIYLFMYLALQAAGALGLITLSKVDGTSYLSGKNLLVVGLCAAFVGFWATSLHSKYWGHVFPIGSFLIGQGEQRYATMDKVRWVVVGLMVTLVVRGIFYFL